MPETILWQTSAIMAAVISRRHAVPVSILLQTISGSAILTAAGICRMHAVS